MTCPECGARKARRHCPALGRQICPTCCGTKRVVEIACPSGCGWLRSSSAHPPAAAQRQELRDRELLTPLLSELSDAEYAVLTVGLDAGMSFRRDAVTPPIDDDLQQAADAMASTAETALRGVIYEHQPSSLVAARLVAAMREAVHDAPMTPDGRTRALDAAVAVAMRRLAQAVRQSARLSPGQPTAFWEFLARVLRPRVASASGGTPLAGTDLGPHTSPDEQPRIILP
jgi:hypothetical protein